MLYNKGSLESTERDMMALSEYFSSKREKISESISMTLEENKALGAKFAGDSAAIFSIMKEYAKSGKMLRGLLACIGSELFKMDTSQAAARASSDAVKVATALELFQAGLLVHDDIMDKDEMRRGKPTMHKIFERIEAEKSGDMPGSASLGEAIGICAGDIYYFIAWKLITGFGAELGTQFSRELIDVCLAQIVDVRLGTHNRLPSLSEILEVYAYKTARYTICLPLCAGALLAGRKDALPYLEALGLNLGILFQLQDDHLGLFAEAEELGKPVGSDIREGKKTPYMILLIESLNRDEAARFGQIFGRKTIGKEEVDYVRSLVKAHGIDARMRELVDSYAKKAETSLADLSANLINLAPETLGLLEEFIAYSLSRKF